jgi:hypothetical protein
MNPPSFAQPSQALTPAGVKLNVPGDDRLLSLDVFRGFTMFWLLGGKGFVVAVAAVLGLDFITYQLAHSEWVGLRYYDLIWPSFMLMVGMSIPFSLAKASTPELRGRFLRQAWRRAIVLFLLGSLRESLHDGVPRLAELSSALQPIAVAYLISCYLAGWSMRAQAAVAVGILAGYAALLAWMPAPGVPAGTYEANRNIVTAVDSLGAGPRAQGRLGHGAERDSSGGDDPPRIGVGPGAAAIAIARRDPANPGSYRRRMPPGRSRAQSGRTRDHETVDDVLRPHVGGLGLLSLCDVFLDRGRAGLATRDISPGGNWHERPRSVPAAHARAAAEDHRNLHRARREGAGRRRTLADHGRLAARGLADSLVDVSE